MLAMKKRIFLIILIILALVFTLSACTKGTNVAFLDNILKKAGILKEPTDDGGTTLNEGVRVLSSALDVDWISECYVGAQIQLTGGKLIIDYSDETIEEIRLTTAMIEGTMSTSLGNVKVTGTQLVEGFDTETAGTLTICVTYEENKAYHRISIKNTVTQADTSIKNIMVKPGTIPRVFYIDDEFDYDTAKLTVNYYDGSVRDIPISVSMLRGFSTVSEGNFSMSVSYMDYSVDYGYSVQKKPLELNEDTILYISVKGNSIKNVYNVGETLSVENGVLIITDSYYAKYEIPILSSYISGFSSVDVGEIVLTITYMEKTCEYSVNIIESENSNAVAVSNATEFNNIRGNLSGSYYLTADIDLSGLNFSPIGTLSAPFAGELDGKGFKIKNLRIESFCNGGYIGLFGVNEGVIMDLEIEDVYINIYTSAGMSVGAIVGLNKGIISSNAETAYIAKSSGIINLTFSNSTSSDIYAGGISGVNDTGSSILASSSTAINIYGNCKNSLVGGIVGDNRGKLLSGCSSSSDLSALTVGGLAGRNSGSIDQSLSSSALSGISVGGIAGYNSGTITGCNTAGTLNGQIAGGIAGKNFKAVIRRSCYSSSTVNGAVYAGGLIGESQSSEISDCYSEAILSGATAGGIVGYSYKDVISNCLLNVAVTAKSDETAIAGGIIGRSMLSVIFGCSSGAEVYAEGKNAIAGGLVGHNAGNIGDNNADGIIESEGVSFVGAGVNAVGSLYAYSGGLVGKNFGYVSNAYPKTNAQVKSTAAYAYAGGIAGVNSRGGNIRFVTSTNNVIALAKSENVTPKAYAGGISGAVDGGIIKESNSLSRVSASSTRGSAFIGGIIGEASANEEIPSAISVYFSGKLIVTALTVKMGGISGINAGTYENCYYNTDTVGVIGAVEGADILGTEQIDGALGKKSTELIDLGEGIPLKGFLESFETNTKTTSATYETYYLPTQNINYNLDIALFKVDVCSVTFTDATDGILSTALVTKGTHATFYTAEKEGYTLIAWEISGREFSFASETVEENIVLIAVWEVEE